MPDMPAKVKGTPQTASIRCHATLSLSKHAKTNLYMSPSQSSFSGFLRKVLKRNNQDDQTNSTKNLNKHMEQSTKANHNNSSIPVKTNDSINNIAQSSTHSLSSSTFTHPPLTNPSILVEGLDCTKSTRVTIDSIKSEPASESPVATLSKNTLYTDTASIKTIASSSRRRRSFDTNASTRAIAESIFSADSENWDRDLK